MKLKQWLLKDFDFSRPSNRFFWFFFPFVIGCVIYGLIISEQKMYWAALIILIVCMPSAFMGDRFDKWWRQLGD